MNMERDVFQPEGTPAHLAAAEAAAEAVFRTAWIPGCSYGLNSRICQAIRSLSEISRVSRPA